ncbi:MAG: hypothetical protein ACI3XM_06790 [Eubacteriales bacterium]
MKIRNISLLLLAGLLAAGSFVSCGDAADKGDVTTPAVVDGSADSASVTTEEIDPFAGFDYGGEEVRILVSANDYDGQGSSVYAIIEEEEENGDVVKDAVYKRNSDVEELLNVNFVYTENTEDYTKIPKTLQSFIMAGDDAYDLVIHDLFPLATLSVQGYFLNVCDNPYVDFSKSYWYESYMKDLAFGHEDIHYLLAGDYFLDILRTAHALYFNKDMFRTLFESPDELYEAVLDGTWTQEKFLQYSSAAYSDVNGDGKKDNDDRYGYCHIGYWGSMIPWVVSSDITFLENDSTGAPVFALNNERSVKLLENLNLIFHNDASHNYSASVEDNNNAFINGHALFGGYQRVCSLEMFRDMETDIGVLPYPKMDESQENYITSSHDTANVGVIPMTCGKFEMMGAVLEVLNRESAEIVMPAYYEKALKIKYSRDDASSQMLDIIRNGISCVFPVAFGNYCNDLPLGKAFSTPLTGKKTDFVSNYLKYEDAAQEKLDELWAAFDSIEQ